MTNLVKQNNLSSLTLCVLKRSVLATSIGLLSLSAFSYNTSLTDTTNPTNKTVGTTNQTPTTSSVTNAPITVSHNTVRYVVNPDYSVEETRSATLLMNTRQAAKSYSDDYFQYNPEFESLEILEAYTTKSHGEKLPVDLDDIVDVKVAGEGKIYDTNREKKFTYPNVRKGDSVTTRYKRSSRSMFDNEHFELFEVASDRIPSNMREVILEVPNSIPVNLDHAGFTLIDKNVTDDTTTWHWQLKDTVAQKREANEALLIQNKPYIMATSLFKQADAGDLEYQLNKENFEVTPKIQTLANKITKDIPDSDRREQAQALYNWVSQNIRYVGIYLGDGGFKAYPAETILENGYADCKSYAVLLNTLLKAKGIDSNMVLIYSGALSDTTKLPLLTLNYNHMISYIPEFDMFIDPTNDGFAQFGTLRDGERGKTAYILADNGKSYFKTVPMQHDLHTVDNEITIKILDNGRAKGRTITKLNGLYDSQMRAVLVNSDMDEKAYVRNILDDSHQKGTGDFKRIEVTDLTKPISITTKFELEDTYKTGRAGSFKLPLGFVNSGIDGDLFEDYIGTERRRTPMLMTGVNMTSTWTYTLPDNMTVTRLPKDVDFTNDIGHYTAQYERTGDTIKVRRVLKSLPETPVLVASKYKELESLQNTLRSDFKQKLAYTLSSKKVGNDAL